MIENQGEFRYVKAGQIEVSGPLSQVFSPVVIAQQLNAKLVFDRATKKITNNSTANLLLEGNPLRKGWEQYYKI